MNTYYNFGIMAVFLTISLFFSIKLLRDTANKKETKLTKLNAISILIINAIAWITIIFLMPEDAFVTFNKYMILFAGAIGVIIPLIETFFPNTKKHAILLYIAAGWIIARYSFDFTWQEATLLSLLWGAFTYLLEPFNNETKIASNSIVVFLLGLAFMAFTLKTDMSVMFLALMLGINLYTFRTVTKNDLINLQMSNPSLHGFAFLTGMFFTYIASLGPTFFMISILIPCYFITERVFHFSTSKIKKLLKKNSETTYFYEKAIKKGANLNALNKYISTYLIIFIMIAAVYKPNLIWILLIAAIFVSLKMFMDLYNWGDKRPTLRETFKQSVSDAKLATEELKKNLKNLKNKK